MIRKGKFWNHFTINDLRWKRGRVLTQSLIVSKTPGCPSFCLWKTEPHVMCRFRGRVIVSTLTSPSCVARPSLCVLSHERRSTLQYTLWLSLNQLFGASAQEKTALSRGDVTDSKTQTTWSRGVGSGGGDGGTKGWVLGPGTVVDMYRAAGRPCSLTSAFKVLGGSAAC